MPETKRPLKVFLCHAHSDKEAVKTIHACLTKDDVWLDKEYLPCWQLANPPKNHKPE
ncbi:MAG: hypothetical protein WA821_02060 [Anaerolineales bacterium]